MSNARGMMLAVVCVALAGPARAQVVEVFHASGPMPSYEVATIKKADPEVGQMSMNGPLRVTAKSYILSAYGMSPLQQIRVVGGPSWIGSDMYTIQGKPSDALRDAMQKMSREDQAAQNHMLQQSLLLDRFKLKTHIETREMQVFELAPAKGGLKFKEVPPFIAPPPGGPMAPPPPPGGAIQPGMTMMQVRDGKTVMNARATTMRTLINMMMSLQEVSGRPIVDKTGFPGSFDVTDLQWAGMPSFVVQAGGPAAGPPPGEVNAASIFTALEETLGLKLTATKGQVEVVVIDSIERPSEN